MSEHLAQISATARKAVQQQDWASVSSCAQEILRWDSTSPEGYFLTGLVMKASRQLVNAAEAFARALELDSNRYDAAIELADQHSIARRNGRAAELLAKYEGALGNSPYYLNMAGTVYADIGMPERALPLYRRANELQPRIDLFQANLAACSVTLGEIEAAKAIYRELLERHPAHQRNHYNLARLEKAGDRRHIEQMKEILRLTNLPPDRNVFLYYAIGKELEDIEEWDEAFGYYKLGGDAVAAVANHDVVTDIRVIETIIDVCDENWIAEGTNSRPSLEPEKTPIFVVGLPRTGTTLAERILSSHSRVKSVGETEFVQMTIRQMSGLDSPEKTSAAIVEAAASKGIVLLSDGYMNAVNYRLGREPFFVDKLPLNFLYLGFIAKAWPRARIVLLRRNPMDTCFSMYKQVFTWAYKFSYSLDGLGRYYTVYDRLCDHWRTVLGDRLVELEYEALTSDPEVQTRSLLKTVGLNFEEACLDFHRNTAACTTASSVQVRERIHTRSVDRWKRFATHLQPLKKTLEGAGIAL